MKEKIILIANLKNLLSFLLIISITISSSLICANAHSGRTDSKGGHYDRSTGEYHYHNGSNSYRNKSEENKITENKVETEPKTEVENNKESDFSKALEYWGEHVPFIVTTLLLIIIFYGGWIYLNVKFKKR